MRIFHTVTNGHVPAANGTAVEAARRHVYRVNTSRGRVVVSRALIARFIELGCAVTFVTTKKSDNPASRWLYKAWGPRVSVLVKRPKGAA